MLSQESIEIIDSLLRDQYTGEHTEISKEFIDFINDTKELEHAFDELIKQF